MTMSPRPASIMAGTAARIGQTVPATFVSSIVASASSVWSRIPPYIPIPAFAIRLSSRPNRAIAVATSRRQSSGDRTSISTAATRSGNSASIASSRSRRRAPITTRAPAPSSSRAVARPMPELAPVTTATVPVRSSMSVSSRSCTDASSAAIVEPRAPPVTPRPASPPGDRVNAHGGGSVPEMTTRTAPPAPVVVEPGTIAPGRARGAATAPSRGPGQAHRRRQVRRRPGLPGRLVRGDDPLDRRARPVRRRSTSTRRSTGRRWSSSPPPTSRATTSSARSRPTSRSSSRSVARSSTTPSRSALLAAPDRATLRAARRAVRVRTETLPRGLRPARLRPRVRRLRDRGRRPRRGVRAPPTSCSRASTGSATRSSSTSRTTR